MNNDPRAPFKSGDQILKNLEAVFVCPVVEYRTEVVYIRTDYLLGEEITEKFSLRLYLSMLTHCAWNVTLSFSSEGSRAAPSATVSGKSFTMHFTLGNCLAMLIAIEPCEPPTSTKVPTSSQG